LAAVVALPAAAVPAPRKAGAASNLFGNLTSPHASSSATKCPKCRQPIGVRRIGVRRVPLFGALANVFELLPRDA